MRSERDANIAMAQLRHAQRVCDAIRRTMLPGYEVVEGLTLEPERKAEGYDPRNNVGRKAK